MGQIRRCFAGALNPSLPPAGDGGPTKFRHAVARSVADSARIAAAAACRHLPGRWSLSPDALEPVNRFAVVRGGRSLVEARMELGYMMRVDLRSASEWYAYYSGSYDTQLVRSVQRLLCRRGAIAVDAGANVGFWTVPLAQRAAMTGGYVIAAEPVPANLERLAENVVRNGVCDHVEIVGAALTETRAPMTMVRRGDSDLECSTGNAAVFIDDGGDARLAKLEVPGLPLDDVLEERGRPHVDVIKADIEGHEDSFLRGALETLDRCRPIIVIEWNEIYFERQGLDAGLAIGAVVDSLGYVCLRDTPEGWITQSSVFSPKPVDDLVLAPMSRAHEALNALGTSTPRRHGLMRRRRRPAMSPAAPAHVQRRPRSVTDLIPLPAAGAVTWRANSATLSTVAEFASDERLTVVIITLNGRARIGRTLEALTALPEAPAIVVVDNGSVDRTAEAIRRDFPHVEVISLPKNIGAAARNVGVSYVRSPYVAFAEDDSWYEPRALREAADLLDEHPEIALINAHVLVGEDRRPEPLHEDMVDTPVPDPTGLPGHRILSFLEGVSIVRVEAFERVGGFDPRLFIGGPEEHLAADLLAAGWELRYVPSIRARHVPDHREPSPLARQMGLRNTLWFAWSRRPLWPALRWTVHVLRSSPSTAATARGIRDALLGLPRVLATRRPLPPDVEFQMALLDDSKMRSRARRYGR
jgi:N-acetylglucosaminyl-diphospho-decaprenol L-rhamnosyltransferase